MSDKMRLIPFVDPGDDLSRRKFYKLFEILLGERPHLFGPMDPMV